MTKKSGFLVTATYFLPIDKKDFNKQRDAYAAMASIEETGELPAGFTDTATLIAVKAKQGSAEVPEGGDAA